MLRITDWGYLESNKRSTVRHHGMMAGGMNRRGNWGTMSDRVAAIIPSSTPGTETPPRQASAATPKLKHCWVVDEHGRLPALLLEWRRTKSGFEGRVVRPIEDAELGWIVVEEWLTADLLEPG